MPPRVRPRAEETPAAALLRQWQLGEEPDLDAFVATLQDVSTRELADLIRVDLDGHWERGRRRLIEDYLRRFPAVAADSELAVDVIYAEFLARERIGERPELAEYERRFPELANVLAEQIGLHVALDALEAESFESPEDVSDADASYEILEQIGSGGMGVVFKARQAALDRYVALKMVRAIDSSNAEVLARFRSEAQVVASLRHPHIVQVYDCGEHEGLPYLAMELVEGGTLADRMDGSAWPPHAAAELLVMLAEAVQYAHDRHVIHRDLKPANVLVVADGWPLDVKITDFGLAKLLAEETSQNTKTFSLLGTPTYMAPEQASGRGRQIGPTADVYSLGAIFYELLTGRPPFVGETPLDTLRMLHSDQPQGVQQLAPHVPRDLATICDKCIERDANRRYQSAGALGADLLRYLQGRPIQARKTGSAERTWRWCRRNPQLAGALGIVAALLVGIAVVSLIYSARLRVELARSQRLEQEQRTANDNAQHRLWDSYLSEATAFNSSHRMGQRFEALALVDKASAMLDRVGRTPEREVQLRNAVLAAVAVPDVRKARTLAVSGIASSDCDLSIAGDILVVVTADGRITGLRWTDGTQRWNFLVETGQVRPLLSQDGKLLAAINNDGVTVFRIDEGPPRQLWRKDGAEHFSFAPDGNLVAYGTRDQGMCLVQADNGQLVKNIGRGRARSDFAFAPRGTRIAVCGTENIRIIDGNTGTIETELPTSTSSASQIAWHPGGEFLAAWTTPNTIGLWNVETGKRVQTLSHGGMPARMKFNVDGSILTTEALWNLRLVAWDVGTGRQLLEVPGFVYHTQEAAPDGRLVFVRLHSDSIDTWELTPGACRELAQSFDTPLGWWGKVAVSPEGRIIAFSSQECLELWDLQTSRRLWGRRFGDCSADFDEDGRLIVACERGLFRWTRRIEPLPPNAPSASTSATQTVVHYDSIEQLAEPFVPWSLSLNTSGRIATFYDDQPDRWLIVDNHQDGKSISVAPLLDVRKSSVSNDNRFVAIGGWEQGGVEIWDVRTGERLAQLKTGPHVVPLFSPDGKFLATTPDGVCLWRTDDWSQIRQLQAMGTTPTGLGMTFSPDSRALAVGHVGGAISLFDPRSGTEFARWAGRESTSAQLLAFSADQRWLVVSCTDERSPAQVWNLADIREALRARGLDWPSDVLNPATPELKLAGQIEIVIDDDGVLSKKAAE